MTKQATNVESSFSCLKGHGAIYPNNLAQRDPEKIQESFRLPISSSLLEFSMPSHDSQPHMKQQCRISYISHPPEGDKSF